MLTILKPSAATDQQIGVWGRGRGVCGRIGDAALRKLTIVESTEAMEYNEETFGGGLVLDDLIAEEEDVFEGDFEESKRPGISVDIVWVF